MSWKERSGEEFEKDDVLCTSFAGGLTWLFSLLVVRITLEANMGECDIKERMHSRTQRGR